MNKDLTTVDGVLNFAITSEEESFQFYTDLAKRAIGPGMSDIFERFAQEELKHKQKLLAVKAGRTLEPAAKKVSDLKIGDYLVDVEPSSDLDYQAALTVAMKKEKAAFVLYTKLAELTENAELQGMLANLAQEEAKHKLYFEMEYDRYILTEM